VVNTALFDGFQPKMTSQEALVKVGPPTGEWVDPYYKVNAPFYVTGKGRISLCRVPTSFDFDTTTDDYSWNTVGYPNEVALDTVITDPLVRRQISQVLPKEGEVNVNILRNIGWGGVTVSVKQGKATRMFITARED
jgi:hypothetical protein